MTDSPPKKRTYRILSSTYAICRLAPGDEIPAWAKSNTLVSITYTQNELSIIAPSSSVPDHIVAEHGWRALAIVGPLDFSLVGVLSSLLTPLAEAKISILALSTYDTDFVLIPEAQLGDALAVLSECSEWSIASAENTTA